jgi:hypothetical protein
VAMTVPPKDAPARRNTRVGPVRLPAEGRQGPVPVWPLVGEPLEAEVEAWAQLWATPQAVAWERFGWTRTVGRYCRLMVAAEELDAPAKVLLEARQLEDRLGLTPRAMRMLLWEITSDEVGEMRPRVAGKSARDRMRAV